MSSNQITADELLDLGVGEGLEHLRGARRRQHDLEGSRLQQAPKHQTGRALRPNGCADVDVRVEDGAPHRTSDPVRLSGLLAGSALRLERERHRLLVGERTTRLLIEKFESMAARQPRICSNRSTRTRAASGLPLRSMMNSSWRNATRLSRSPIRRLTSMVDTFSAMQL
jgi:hypothetical protein